MSTIRTEKPANFLIFPCIEINYKLKMGFCNDLQFNFFKAAFKGDLHGD